MSATDPSTSVQERLTVPSDVRISTIKGARFRRNRIATIGMIAAFVLAAIPLLFVIGNVVVKGLPVVTAKFLVSDIPNSAAADELSSDCETLRKYDPTAECDDEAVVEKVLRRARAPRGAVVVTATDGRVLALAGRRTEDPTGAGEGINDPRVALDAWAPSASIFKVVSAAALVEAGVGKSDKVCFHGGVRSVMESNLSDSRLDGRCADLSYGVAHSQNAIIAKLVHQHLTPAQLTDVAHRFGFDRQVALPTPAAFGRVSIPADKGVEFARTAAGFSGVELSAVGGALVANTIATGGIAAPPRLVAGYLDGTGETGTGSLPAPHPVGDRVLEESVADQVAAMMTATCKDGSAARAFAGRDKIPGVAVAGKTGTLSSNEPFYMQYSWFVGFAPADRPTMSISVLLGNPELWQIKAHTAARMVLIEALRSRAGS